MPKKMSGKERDLEISERDPNLIQVGIRVREVRESANLSQRQLAEIAGVSQAYMMAVEAGSSNLSVALLCKLASVLGVAPAVLLETTGIGDNTNTIYTRLTSELYRVANSLDSQRDSLSKIIVEFERRLKQSPSNAKGSPKKH
jgi:transcriptional regulator with XRE-family HTH domain